MTRLLALWVTAALLAPLAAQETAALHLYCLSVKFDPVTTNIGGATYTVEFGVLERTDVPANGELRPGFENSVGGFQLLRGFYRMTIPGYSQLASDDVQINLPHLDDLNGNGIADFFEVSQGVDAAADPSVFETPGSDGKVEAYWTRPAGSPRGTLRAHMTSPYLHFLDATFLIPFRIEEYDGVLTYLPGDSTVSGTASLTGALSGASKLTGPLAITKFNSDLLAAIPGAWTNASAGAVSYRGYITDTNQSALIGRTGNTYEGLMAFDDGWLGRGNSVVYDLFGNIQPVVWDMLIVDTNDYDQDGIPDFSDANLPPPPPRLSLVARAQDLLFTLAGRAGLTYHLEESLSVQPPQWSDQLALTLTNDTQTFSVPFPTNEVVFWRARTP